MIPLIIVLVLACAVWVYIDAQARDWTTTKYRTSTPQWWAGMTALIWVVYFPWYLAARRLAPRRNAL
jgi:hypothetical protein